MDSTDTELQACYDRINSGKIMERKRGVTDLQDLLDRDAVIQRLNSLSKTRTDADPTYTWNSFFIASHKALLTEVERNQNKVDQKGATSRENNKRLFMSLVTITAKRGTEDGAFIKCGAIIDAVMFVLQSPYYRNEIGSIYVNILYERILSVPKYWSAIKCENWTSLFELFVKIFDGNPIPNTNTSLIIATINSVIKYGCENSSLLIDIKFKIITFLKKLVQMTIKDSIDFQFICLKLVLTTCEKLKKECRITICKFTEEIFDRLLDIGRTLNHSDKKQILIDILLLAVECHHPNGVTQDSDTGAYAHDWDDWNKKLKKLNYVIHTELENKQRYRKLQALPTNFVKLAVEVHNQIFRSGCNYIEVTINSTNNESFLNNERSSSSKRRRIMSGFPDIVEKLKIESEPVDMWPWLSVLSSLISRYPSIVNDCDYILLLQSMCKFLSVSKEPTVTDYLCQCCMALIDVRQNGHLNNEPHEEEEVAWDSVWNLVLRTIGLNQNVEWSHKLLQHMMLHKWKSTMGNSVLKLFVSQVVRISSFSIATLHQLRLRFSFPITILDIPVHSILLRWLLPITSEYSSVEYLLMNLPLEEYAHFTVLTCLQSSVKKKPATLAPFEFDISSHSSIPTADIHKLSSYNCDIFDRKNEKEEMTATNEEKAGCIFNQDAFEKFLNFLKDHQQSLFTVDVCRRTIDAIINEETLDFSDALKTVQYLNRFIVFLVHVQRFLEFYAMHTNTLRLRKIRCGVQQKSFEISQFLLRTDLKIDEQINLYTHMRNFFQSLGSLPAHLIEEILEQFFPLLEPAVCCLEQANMSDDEKYSNLKIEDESLFDFENLSERDRLLLESCKLLVYYSFNRTSLSDKQYNVFNTVLEILFDLLRETEECSRAFLIMSTFSLQAVFTLKSLRCANTDVDLYPNAVEIIKQICLGANSKWCKIEESALVLLKSIQQAINTSHSQNYTSKWRELLNLICDLKEIILPDCGSRIHIEMARCLFSFKINCPSRLNSLSDENVEILLTTSSGVLKYLENPFHEVQVNVISWLPSIFALMDWIANDRSVNEMLNNFLASLFNIFDVEDSDDDMPDDNVNRPLIVFYALASAICNSKTTRRRQIFTLFHITHEKRLNDGLAFKILNLVSRHLQKELNDLVKDNLEFVLFSWFAKYNTFENFPFQALGRDSTKDFYNVHMKEVVVVLYSADPEFLKIVSDTLEAPLLDVVNKCFPEIMAILCRKFAEGRISNGNFGTISKFKQFVENTLTNEVIERMTTKNLAHLLTCILRQLHDPEFQVPKPCVLPLPTSLVSNVRLVRETIKYLQELMGTNFELVVYVAEQYPKFVQKIFQKLYVTVLKASTEEVRLESLQRYFLFCELLMPHHVSLTKLRISSFITRTITANLLCFLSSNSSDITFLTASLKFFLRFTSRWLLPDERFTATGSVFSECLTNIVNTLVIVMSKNSELVQSSLEIMRYLLNGQFVALNESMTHLEPFPNRVEFHEFQISGFELSASSTNDTNLRNNCESFLKAIQNSVYSPRRVESLKYLRKQLASNESEKIDFFERCVSPEFSENNDRNIAHRLICTLIEHTKCKNDEVKYEAVRCLCEIGLVDLHTLVLKHGSDSAIKPDREPETLIAEKVCLILKDCIVDDNVDLVNAACRVLYQTLFSVEGFQVISNKMDPLQKSFLHPFVPRSSGSVQENNLWHFFSTETFKECVDSEHTWFPTDDPSYDKWIENLVSALCESFNKECFLNTLQTVSKLKVSISETIFKYFVNLLTTCEVREPAEICGRRINQFLENYFNSSTALEDSPDSVSSRISCVGSKSIYNEKSSVQILLDAADFVRLNQTPDTNGLNLNYLYVAKAALHCNAYFTCILYAELHINSLVKKYKDVPYDGNILSYVEEVGNRSPEDVKDFLNILREAFWKIGDSDALYGCGSSSLLCPEARITHYQQIGNWQRVIESCDTSLAYDPFHLGRVNDLTQALENTGFNHLQKMFLSASEQLNQRLRDAQYHCAWKLGQWDVEEPCDDEKTFSYHQYAALKDIHQRNYESVRINVEHARHSLVHRIARVGLESTKNVYHVLAELQCLQDIEKFICVTDVNEAVEQWRKRDSLSVGLNFDHKQTIFDQRVRMVDTDMQEARNFVLDIARRARREGQYNFANICLSLIRDKEEPSSLNELRVRLEDARVLYRRGETYVARYVVKDLLKKDATKECDMFNAVLLRTYGKWLAELNLENADTILENYFEPASQLVREMPCETENQRKVRVKTYKQVAEFADLQYQQITGYMKSDEFKKQLKNIQEARVGAQAMDAGDNLDLKKSKIMLSNQSKAEASQVQEILNKEKRYLMLALKFYLKVLAECDEEDQKVFRVISFWLDQKKNVELHKELKSAICKIPSYKFLSVLPQLMAHLTCNTAEIFGNLLNKLLEKCAHDHPHHTLPVIFSIKNYTAENTYDPTPSSNKNEDRVKAASDLIGVIRAKKSVQKIVSEMDEMNAAYIELAYFIEYSKTVNAIPIPQKLRILKIKNYEHVFCPTYTVPINRTGNYPNVVGVRRVGKTFLLLGGINAPKKIECLCTDGQIRLQMVKGKDDLRADAVMQQVFVIMNELLKANKHTSKRKLLLRTYKIVPLSQRSGVFEFCTNTITLGRYLSYGGTMNPGAHHRLRPQDMKTSIARSKMEATRKTPFVTEETRLKLYDEICSSIKPVFRYFFIEHFPSSTVWFERKLAYTHSVATTSMVGYILGIGDRHVQNILIDQTTAEVIHIDFGVAFDQGLNLTTPELVPFRLTRDIEDGMGIFSIDGIFRRCCELVMAVLRENSEIIRTTSEVFLHDPLYQWTLTAEKRASSQNQLSGSESTPKSQDLVSSRALSRLKLKLQGMEDGIPTNVEGQVNRLIQQAKDRRNLGLIFEGWQPHM